MQLESLRARAQEFMEAVSREGYLAYAGRKDEAAFQQIYDAYADILTSDVLAWCLEQYRNAPDGSEAQRAARLMLDWQIDSQTGRQLAALDDREVALENSTVVTLDDGRTAPYQSIAIDIANCDDRRERNAWDAARARVVGDVFAPLRLEHLQREQAYVESLGVAPNYNATFEALSGISLQGLADECSAFLRDTQPMWDDVIADRLKAFGVPVDGATRADALALFRLKEFDAAFPGSEMESRVRGNCAEMGIDATADGRIIFDLGDRPGKRSRAFCSPVRVPNEVYLVLRPHGGQTDYNTFLHELGHALHFGYARPDYPFEYRWLGDNSVTESYAMLFDHRMQDRGWLLRYTELGTSRVREFLRLAALEELHFLRRYCAKFIYEVQVYGGAVPQSALPALYADTLTRATSFQYREADAFTDLDPHYYSSRYLRAWQLQAVVNASLTERFNDDWWRNPAAGPWIVRELFGEGQRETANEIAARVSGTALSFAPLITHIEKLLDVA
jgi:hypothetical protein